MMWYAHISLSTPSFLSFSPITHMLPTSWIIPHRYTSYTIHVVHVSVFADTCCFVWWVISTIPIYLAYVLSCIVVIDSWWYVVHRCIVWCVVVASSCRWVLTSSFVIIVCVISSVLSSPSFLLSSSPLLPSSSLLLSWPIPLYFHATL